MREYDSYKDSKIDAFGDIPVEWKVIRMKHLVDSSKYYQIGDGDHGSIKPEMYQFDSGIPYIRVQNLTWNGKLDFNGMVYISDEVQEKNLKSKLIPNDILIAKTGATIGKLAIIPDEIEQANTTSSVGKITVNQSRFNSKYVLYAMMSRQFTDQIWIEASQKSAQPGFNVDDLVLFQIAIPKTLEEQTAIANYLDRKTAEIDELIADKKRLLELYEEEKTAIINQAVTKGINPDAPMKDSGIEWLGEIPEHWEVKRLKYVISQKLMYGANESAEEEIRENPRYIRITDFGNDGKLKDDTFKSLPFEKAKDYLLADGDILFARSGATVGKTFQFKNHEGLACFAGYLIKARPNPEVLESDFLYYFTKSGAYENWKSSIFNQATIQNIGADKYAFLELPLPPNIQQQQSIVRHIETECARIDAKKAKTEKLIELLQEYRQALISEVVTGKIKVTE